MGSDGARILTLPWTRPSPYRKRKIIQGANDAKTCARPMRANARAILIEALRDALRWLDELLSDPGLTLESRSLRGREGLCVASRATLGDQLRRKSRNRREAQERMALASAGHRRRNDTLPSLELSYVPLGELRPAGRKLRKLDPAHVRAVASSIGLLGSCDPLLIGRNNEIIDGETRFEAAKQLGLDRVPCLHVEHLNPDEQRVLRLAVNRLAEKGQWDLDALKIEFEELILLDAPIEITGFSPAETDHVILGDATERLEAGPLEPTRTASLAVATISPRPLVFGERCPGPISS